MKEKNWNLFKEENPIQCGDGRMDSPGFNAKHVLYIKVQWWIKERQEAHHR